jgi:hypothetical protein
MDDHRSLDDNHMYDHIKYTYGRQHIPRNIWTVCIYIYVLHVWIYMYVEMCIYMIMNILYLVTYGL